MTGILLSRRAPFGVGFAISFSLILAIGAQNAFVLRQGLMRRHVGALVFFCAVSDAVLIVVGVGGVAPVMAQWLTAAEKWLFAGAAIWLGVYGPMRGSDAWRGHGALKAGSVTHIACGGGAKSRCKKSSYY